VEGYTDSTVTQEPLEAAYTFFDECLELASIAWDYTAVEADIDPAFALGSVDLYVKILYSRSGRDGIQWHVNDSGHTAKGSSPGTSPEAFPFCSTWFIEMDMGIDQSRKQDVRRVVGVRCAFREVCRR